MADQNFRVMTSNVSSSSVADFSGVKIRTMENSYHMAFWSAIGCSPTPMAFSELFSQMRAAGAGLYEEIRQVVNDDELFMSDCGSVYPAQ